MLIELWYLLLEIKGHEFSICFGRSEFSHHDVYEKGSLENTTGALSALTFSFGLKVGLEIVNVLQNSYRDTLTFTLIEYLLSYIWDAKERRQLPSLHHSE